jgi:ribosomal protein L37E
MVEGVLLTRMTNSSSTESPFEKTAGAASSYATEAFELLSNETRLAILLTLWDAYDPRGTDNAMSFSDLYDRVNVRDTGNFTYHLDKLTGHFVTETDDGYRLRNAGHKIVQAVIAGTGLEDPTIPPTEIARSCHRCGAPVELSYEDERLYHICTACEGSIGPDSTEAAPVGTLVVWDFDPAGLTDRTPGDVYVAGTIAFLRDLGMLNRGLCPECSGPVDGAPLICDRHESTQGTLCSRCGTRDEVRVSYVCSVCKHGASFPVQAAVHDHPAIVAFYYEHGIEGTYHIEAPEACGRLWDHLLQQQHALVTEDPVRVRVTVPCDEDALRLTLDEELSVIEIAREYRETVG